MARGAQEPSAGGAAALSRAQRAKPTQSERRLRGNELPEFSVKLPVIR
jgi:hypothetical protein